MAAKSSQKAKNAALALLSLWSIISLIVIVVWATSPDMKGSAQCRAELQETTEKMEGAKVVFRKDKEALEQMVLRERQETAHQRAEVLLLLGHLNATNFTLEECRREGVDLKVNISALLDDIKQLRQVETNLTTQLRLQEEHIEVLQHNVTQSNHQTMSCLSLKTAAESQMVAAQSQTKGCESAKEYLQKQLQKCKDLATESAQQTQQQPPARDKNAATSPLSGIPALMLLVCGALHLIT
ncbi:uncharacterized protein V6R79_025510 [Siganus canaliculatus]